MGLRVYAHQPDERRYLLIDEDAPADEGRLPGLTPVRVLDARADILHKPLPLGSVLARNFHYQLNEDDAPDAATLLEDVEARGPPADEIGDLPPTAGGSQKNTIPDE